MHSALQRNLRQSDLRVFVGLERDRQSRVTRIAAVLYDTANGSETAAFDRAMRAGDGQDFADTLANFASFCAAYPVWTFDDGQKLLEKNCGHYSVEFPFRHPFIRVRALLRGWGVNPAKYSSGTLHEAAGLTMAGSKAGALHDARSVAGAVSFFENVGLL